MRKEKHKRQPIVYSFDADCFDEDQLAVEPEDIMRFEDLDEIYQIMESVYTLIDAKLSTRERQVLTLKFGLCGEDEHGTKEISELLGIAPSTVRTILCRAIGKLRSDMPKLL